MSVHIAAKPGDIAETVLLPGDPLRAKFIAESFLQDAECYNNVRGMMGFTGVYKDQKISVQGSGMGMPSMAIYVNELITSYGVKKIIRVGSCGSLQEYVHPRDIIIAMSASTDSAMNATRLQPGAVFAPTASYALLEASVSAARTLDIPVHVGSIFSSDTFYHDDPDTWKLWQKYGLLGVEMEAAQLYSLGAKHGIDTLALLTVSDSLVTHKELSSEERQTGFHDMMRVALETIRPK